MLIFLIKNTVSNCIIFCSDDDDSDADDGAHVHAFQSENTSRIESS